MTCAHPIWGLPDSTLTCGRVHGHTGPHIYKSSTGSDVRDRHDNTSGGEH